MKLVDRTPTYSAPVNEAPTTPVAHEHRNIRARSIAPPPFVKAPERPHIFRGDLDSQTASLTRYQPDSHTAVIYGYGSDTAPPPTAFHTPQERGRRVYDYANRVLDQIWRIESGSEGQRNIKFQSTRQFMEPSGYFSGGLLAAGFDPHEKITVTFTSYRGKGKPEVLTDTEKRTYFAWEIAAGALAHDKVDRGGPLNFRFMKIEPKDQNKVKYLETLGTKLQDRWENDVSKPMRNASGALAQRSGKADAYVLRGTLQSLRSDKEQFEKLSPEGQVAVTRTLDKNGQVIIPNIYGYPLGGYAFIPYTPYDDNYENRPNKGVIVDLKNGAVHEIQGDEDFADWAKNNRDNVLRSFNARDRQGSHDVHWPQARHVLDTLISSNTATYSGYRNPFRDKDIPVRELFNYTRSRNRDYHLKLGNLNNGIASQYQAVNSKNAVWSDQTEVFGSSQQNWKAAKEFWNNTFGYVPVIGNTGNILFGIHDSLHGMTADDRVGGTAAAVISSLQLAHELALSKLEPGQSEPPTSSAAANKYRWNYNSQTRDFELVRTPETGSHAAPLPRESASLVPVTETATLTQDGELITLSGTKENLVKVQDNLYVFSDMNKKGAQHRLNIIGHGNGTHIYYNGKMHTPQGLLNTLKRNGIFPEHYDNIRILSCYSGKLGEDSFAAEFQRLTQRPVKGYVGEVIARYSAEKITGDPEVTYNSGQDPIYTERSPGDSVENRVFDPIKGNPYSVFKNPFKWWTFKSVYQPIVFSPTPK